MNPTSKVRAALIGGVFVGVLSSIPIVSCLCCAWAIAGGMLASHLWMRHQPPSLQAPYGDSALLGLMTAGVAALVGIFVQLPIQLLMGAAGGMGDSLEQVKDMLPEGVEIPEQLFDMMSSGAGSAGLTIVSVLIGAVFSFVLYAIFVTIGSLIGAAVFHKKA